MSSPTHFNDRFLRLALPVVLATAFPLNAAMAQQNDFDPGSRDSLAVHQPLGRGRVDQVDPQNGNLLVRHVDLTMKGNGHLDIVVHRTYDMLSGSAGLKGRAYSDSYRWASLGAGWSLSAAPRYAEYKDQPTKGLPPKPTVLSELCSGQVSKNFNLETSGFLEMPNGERDPLVSVGGGRALTQNNWKAECFANVLTVRSPEGLIYDFGDVSAPWRGQDGPQVMFALAYSVPARKVTDLSGNWISFEYRKVGAPSPLTGYSPSRITSSDGRQVDFTYNETSRRLLSMQDNTGRVWTYEHAPTDDSSAPTLLSVTLPGNETWRYTYAPGPSYSWNEEQNAKTAKLQTLTYPEGGTVTYEVEAVPYNFIASGDQAQVITKKRERVVRVTRSNGEQWTYSYQHGAAGQYDTTIETTPLGVVTYKFMGSRFVLPAQQGVAVDNIWLLGHLMEKVDQSGNQEINTWTRREMSAHPIQFGTGEQMNDNKIWTADLTERKIVRDGATYVTRFSGYDSYGNATSVTEVGPAGETRTTTRTFYIDPNKWIVNRVKDEIRPADTTTRSFDGNGNLLSISRNGVTTSYMYDSGGNIATMTAPRSLVHTYGAYHRGVAQSEAQPEGISISRIVSDAGNITSETNGEGKTTTYDYDGQDRVTRIGYPTGTATTISYGPNSKSVTRGALTENTIYDDFGRVASITLGGVARTFKYDALDRRTFESDPGTLTGTGYEFDNFNRVTHLHNADGSSQTISYSGNDKIVTDERNKVTTFRYRSYGDPSERYLMNVATPEPSASIALTRNGSDLVSTITQDGITRSYNYNSNHYLTSVINPETGTTTYGRDAAGNMTTRSVGGSGNTYYTYDGQNRLTSVTYPGTTPAVTKPMARPTKSSR
jgi:YD repeat-containing protein